MARRFTSEWLDDHRVQLTTPVGRDAIIGIGHVMTEIDSVLGRLQHPEAVIAMGGELPRGILLHGEPGLGKTLVARYMAGSLGADVPMYEISADELTPLRVRGLFRHLSQSGHRSVVYLDEIDLVGMNRGWEQHGPTTRAVLVSLLAGLDGLQPTAGPILIASSNRPPHHLDPALVRHGRLGYRVRFTMPDQDDRQALLVLFLAKRPTAGDLAVKDLAALAFGYTPASLKQAVDDATGLALADGRHAIAHADLVTAIRRDGRVTAEDAEPNPDQLRRTAVHEAGHVGVAVVLRGPDYVRRVRVAAGEGDTAVGDEELSDHALATDELFDRIAIGMAGIEAEGVVLGGASLGGHDDLRRATRLLHEMAQSGLIVGAPTVDLDSLGGHAGPVLKDAIGLLVPPQIADARGRAAAIVRENATAIEAFATRLLEADGYLVEEPLREAIAAVGFAGAQA